MVRAFVCSLVVLALSLGALPADDKKDTKDEKTAKDSKSAKNHKFEAKVTKVDAKKGTITLKWKGKDGKEMEKTFKLAEDIRYMDSTGKVAAIDIFESGHWVLVLEKEGKIVEMKKKNEKSKTEKSKTETSTKPDKK